jgi:putative addiction module killer protein
MFLYCSVLDGVFAPNVLAFCIYMDTMVIEVLETDEFKAWLSGLKDRQALLTIGVRLARLSRGLLGDHRPVGDGVSELRIHVGPGYRIYLVQRGDILIVLLHGGDKGSQVRDIQKAKAIARSLEW